MLTVFCYYTNDQLYKDHASILEFSVRKLGIEFKSFQYSKDEWSKITALKPNLIKKVRDEVKGGILYIDADAIVLNDITDYFKSIKEDIGAHYFKGSELLSGTLYFNDTDGARKIIDEWEKEQKRFPEEWDQKVLQRVITKLEKKKYITIKKLPPEYTFIFDLSKEYYSDTLPVIEHLQASRDVAWLKKYNNKNFFVRKIMLTRLKSISRNIMKRHSYVNKRCKQLGINIELTLKKLAKI